MTHENSDWLIEIFNLKWKYPKKSSIWEEFFITDQSLQKEKFQEFIGKILFSMS